MMWLLWGPGKLLLSQILAPKEVDSNKIISLPFTMSSVGYLRVGLDQKLWGSRQDSVLLMHPEKGKVIFFPF